MYDLKRIGKNIRSLRQAFGETQEELGIAVHVEKNTISSYETGTREPKKGTLSDIAKHYMISIGELMHSDLSDIESVSVDYTLFWKNIDLILPIVSSEKAEKNENFSRAVNVHRSLYDGLHKLSLDAIDRIDVCLDGYAKVCADEKIGPEASANLLAVFYLLMAMIKNTATVINDRPAAIMQLAAKDRRVNDLIENPDPGLKKACEEMIAGMKDPEIEKYLTDLKFTLKQSSRLSDLCDYYLALQYFLNLVDNDLTSSFNRRIGIEMFISFVTVGNCYAAELLRFLRNATGSMSGSQSVDDNR